VTNEDAVYVGDTEIDIKAATAAEVDCVGVATGAISKKDLSQCGAKWVCDNLSELLSILGIAPKE
jgi:phosphoglycolate phosphatase